VGGVKILALDLSLTHTGWASDVAGLPAAGSIRTAQLRGVERLDLIVREVQALARGTGLVALEGYSYASPNQAHQMGELGGPVRLLLYRLGIPMVVVQPSGLKKFATGKGNANKDQMLAAAIRRYAFAGTDNNEADAWLLYWMARRREDASWRGTAYEHEAFKKVQWPTLEAPIA
jgi:crossover junction endodeoxyribonuclease RuvC